MNESILQGFLQATLPINLMATGIGSFIGLIVGMIPGMTISSGIIIVLPLTFVLDPDFAIALLLGVYVGGMMGGSFTAILLNIPGTPSSSATAMDGHPMSLKGEAGRALGTSITASFIGGLFSFFCLYFIAPSLAEIALKFHAQDLFSLVFFGLTIICSFAAKSLVKGLLSAMIGLLIVTVGQDPMLGTPRFTFGQVGLLSGFHFLTALVGLFAIPELVNNLIKLKSETAQKKTDTQFGSIILKVSDLKQMRVPVTIGSLVGAFLGILPGVGGPIAAFISYDYAKKMSKDPEQFGHGSIEGVAAPESANNAVTGGALIPMMTLGIPGDPATAILIGALLVHGLAPGPLLFIENASFAYTIIFAFFWANIFNFAIATSGLRLLVKLLSTPKAILMPIIALLCVVGSYALQNSFFDVYSMFFFGMVGLAMRWLKMPVVPLLLALVLGKQLEEHLRVALTASKGDVSIFFTSSFSVLFLCLSAISIFWAFYANRKILTEK